MKTLLILIVTGCVLAVAWLGMEQHKLKLQLSDLAAAQHKTITVKRINGTIVEMSEFDRLSEQIDETAVSVKMLENSMAWMKPTVRALEDYVIQTDDTPRFTIQALRASGEKDRADSLEEAWWDKKGTAPEVRKMLRETRKRIEADSAGRRP